MPRGFTTQESDLIIQKLKEAGLRLFPRLGIRKTTVEALAHEAGIGKGSFYRFFPSKEYLCFVCMEEQEKIIQKNVILPLMKDSLSQSDFFRRLVELVFSITEDYPFIKLILDPAEYAQLLRGLPDDLLKAHMEEDNREMSQWMKMLEARNITLNLEPSELNGIFKALLFVNLHKKEIGSDVFPRVVELLTEFTSRGLESCMDNKEDLND